MHLNGNSGYEEFTLSNGLAVAVKRNPSLLVNAKLRVNFGACHEGEGEEGMTHFIEHFLMSAGSPKYEPRTSDFTENDFGYFNAQTNIGRTSFVTRMESEDVPRWLDFMSDHLFRSLFDREMIEGERRRVLREIADEKSNPEYPAQIELERHFYRGHPKQTFVLGREEVVANAQVDKIRGVHDRGYKPNNMDLILVGGLPMNICELICQSFEGFASGEDTRRTFPQLEPLPERSIFHRSAPELINEDNRNDSSARIILSCVGPKIGHEDELAFSAMTEILGGEENSNSLFYRNVALANGLAYDISSTYDGSYNAGELEVRGLVPARRIDFAIDSIFQQFGIMRTREVRDEDVRIFNRRRSYNHKRTLQSNAGFLDVIERKLDLGLAEPALPFTEITKSQIMEVANRYLPDRDGKYVLSVRNPLKNGHSLS